MRDPYDPDLLAGAQSETVDLLRSAAAQSWDRTVYLSGRGIRIACSCRKNHNAWIDISDADPGYASRARTVMLHKTCWEEEDEL